jgi:serine protease Do
MSNLSTTHHFDVIIVGSGGAGLSLALSLPQHFNIAVLAKSNLTDASTFYAQGGVAAVLDETDSIEQHIDDTMIAGAHLCETEAVKQTVEGGKPSVDFLLKHGVQFTLDDQEQLHLTREGGYLLTNHHVVEDASKVTIMFNDRRELDATVVGSDERTDVALLKVNGTNFPSLRAGNVDQLRVGEPVLAIGSPFGFDYSASAGIVSAKMRNMMGETSVPFIQTDVALNPGNSGGPLFNQQGEVVGVNSRIFSGTGGYMGLSFSIPIDVAMDIADQLKKTGKVTRSYLGFNLQDLDRNLAESYNLPKPEGSLITNVQPNSPAQKAGLKAGDIILKFNGTPISRTSELLNYLNRTMPNQTVQLEVLRDDKKRNISATLTTAPDDTPAKSNTVTQSKGPVLGIAIRNLAPAELSQLNVKGGVLIQEVKRGGAAAQSGMAAGDVVTHINSKVVKDTNDFVQVASELKKGQVARVGIIRQGTPAILGMRIQ